MRPWPHWLPDAIKAHEGLHDGDKTTPILEPQRDPVGLWTLGWGHLWSMDPDAEPPEPITLEQADVYLDEDMREAQAIVDRYVQVPLTGGQYGALIDFAYNVGEVNFTNSTLLRVLNAGRHDEVPAQFRRWVYGAGSRRRLPGLVKRRENCVRMWKGEWAA